LPEFPKEIELTMKAATPPPELMIEEKKKIWEERESSVSLFHSSCIWSRGQENYEDAMRGVIERGT